MLDAKKNISELNHNFLQVLENVLMGLLFHPRPGQGVCYCCHQQGHEASIREERGAMLSKLFYMNCAFLYIIEPIAATGNLFLIIPCAVLLYSAGKMANDCRNVTKEDKMGAILADPSCLLVSKRLNIAAAVAAAPFSFP
jgi:hypothetical protein